MEALAVGLGFLEIGAGISGAFRQRSVEREQVQLEYESNLYDIKQREREQRYVLGATKALGETSGTRHTLASTGQQYVDVMRREFKEELDFAKYYAKTAKRLGMTAANLRFKQNYLGSIAGGAKTIAGGMG